MYVCVYFTMLSKQINNKKSLFSLFLYMPLTCNVVKCFESLKVLCKFRIIIYIHLYKCRRAPNTNFNLVFWSYFFSLSKLILYLALSVEKLETVHVSTKPSIPHLKQKQHRIRTQASVGFPLQHLKHMRDSSEETF